MGLQNAANKLKARAKDARSSSLLRTASTTGTDYTDTSSHDPVQVEPKTYFANERTFIQWISAALLLLTVSSIMMGSGSYNGTSSVIAFSALILVSYASFVYFRRVRLLRSGQAFGYLDFVGPTILAAGVGLGVFIVFADAVKGSEFLTFGESFGRRRFLAQTSSHHARLLRDLTTSTPPQFSGPQEIEGTCTRHSIEGINLLEYQPRDILLKDGDLIVATPQTLVSHLLSGTSTTTTASTVLSQVSDIEIQSLTSAGKDRLFALSTGPLKTELVEFHAADNFAEIQSRFVVQEAPSTAGSVVFVSADNVGEGKFYVVLDGAMHTYHLDGSLSRIGSINMKMLNQGGLLEKDPITAMEHFEGVTYLLRQSGVLQGWDLQTATLQSELLLPQAPTSSDRWAGMALERQNDSAVSHLRKKEAEETSVFLHMSLDTFPPELWTFRLEASTSDSVFTFPTECGGMAMN